MSLFLKFAICGATCGIVNGFFGGGGGLVLIPLLCSLANVPPKRAFSSSVFIIVPISAVSAFIYFSRGAINFIAAIPYLIGGIIGGFIAGKLFSKVPALWLRRALGILMLYGGIRMALH